MTMLGILVFFMTEFKHTAVFDPMNRDDVAISGSGDVLILDRMNREIMKFDPMGNRILTIKSTAGVTLDEPRGIRIWEDRLYVMDLQGVLVFSLDGSFQKTIKPDRVGLQLIPARNGYVAFGLYFDKAALKITNVYQWCDADGKVLKTIGQFEENGEIGSAPAASLPEAKGPVFKFNPARPITCALVDRTGRFLLFKGMEDQPIKVFSLEEDFKESTKIMLPKRNPQPFNRQWADEKLKRLKAVGKGPGTWVPDYPDHFPMVRNILLTPENLIEIQLWTKDPMKPGSLYFKWDGSRVADHREFDQAHRILAVNKDQAYLSTFDALNKDYCVQSVPLSEVETLLSKLTPLPYQLGPEIPQDAFLPKATP